VDVSDAASPNEIGFYYHTFGEANDVAVTGDPSSGLSQVYIYVADQQGGLVVLRVRYRVYLPLVLRNHP